MTFALMFGPMTGLMMALFGKKILAKNMSFLPGELPLFILQTMFWMLWIIPLIMLIYAKSTEGLSWI